MKNNFYFLLPLLILVGFCQSGCNGQAQSNPDGSGASPLRAFSIGNHSGFSLPDYEFPYDLMNPEHDWELDDDLDEISGLTWHSNESLGCVQDERGDIFFYDFGDKSTKPALDFGKGGDYEGVEKVGNRYWVVRSDGRLYEVRENGKEEKFDTWLDDDYDVEGLGYQPNKNRLLLACKGYPGKGDYLKNRKAIYAFDLKTKKLGKEPVYTVNLTELEELFTLTAGEKLDKSLGEFFSPGKGNMIFQPSGIAVHPTNGDIYLVAHVGKLLVVLSPEGDLKYVEGLNEDKFEQPEGICFSPYGDLYISNEGKKADVKHFKPKK